MNAARFMYPYNRRRDEIPNLWPEPSECELAAAYALRDRVLRVDSEDNPLTWVEQVQTVLEAIAEFNKAAEGVPE